MYIISQVDFFQKLKHFVKTKNVGFDSAMRSAFNGNLNDNDSRFRFRASTNSLSTV